MSITVLKCRPASTNNGTSLVRLERSFATLIQLREKLTSHWLEPTTFSMHETKETFLNRIDVLVKLHQELTHTLGNSRNSTEMELEAVEKQLIMVKNIEKHIKDYIFSKISIK